MRTYCPLFGSGLILEFVPIYEVGGGVGFILFLTTLMTWDKITFLYLSMCNKITHLPEFLIVIFIFSLSVQRSEKKLCGIDFSNIYLFTYLSAYTALYQKRALDPTIDCCEHDHVVAEN